MSRLLTKKDVATMFCVGRDAAASLMDSWGVPTLDLGPGRGRGRRWDALDVERAVAARKRETEAAVAASPGRRRKEAPPMATKDKIAALRAKRKKLPH